MARTARCARSSSKAARQVQDVFRLQYLLHRRQWRLPLAAVTSSLPLHFPQTATGSEERIQALLRNANTRLLAHPEARRRQLQLRAPTVLVPYQSKLGCLCNVDLAGAACSEPVGISRTVLLQMYGWWKTTPASCPSAMPTTRIARGTGVRRMPPSWPSRRGAARPRA